MGVRKFLYFSYFFQNIKSKMKMVKNRRRKRIGSTTKLSISRDSMRPYIKEIEKLRAENYLLQQKKTQSLTQPQKIRESSEFESSVLEYKIQLDHKNYECSRLMAEKKISRMKLNNKDRIISKSPTKLQYSKLRKMPNLNKYYLQSSYYHHLFKN